MNNNNGAACSLQVDQISVSSVKVSELDAKAGCTVCGEQGGGH